jgi:hypothetical protein
MEMRLFAPRLPDARPIAGKSTNFINMTTGASKMFNETQRTVNIQRLTMTCGVLPSEFLAIFDVPLDPRGTTPFLRPVSVPHAHLSNILQHPLNSCYLITI